MKFELTVPDSTPIDVQKRIARLIQVLSLRPELVNKIDLEGDSIQSLFTAERMAIVAEASHQVDRGEMFTADQVQEYFVEKSESWRASEE